MRLEEQVFMMMEFLMNVRLVIKNLMMILLLFITINSKDNDDDADDDDDGH